MPRDFKRGCYLSNNLSMQAVNSTDTEAISLTDPPTIARENRQARPPAQGWYGADAAALRAALAAAGSRPDLCAQNLAGRQLVARAQVEDETTFPRCGSLRIPGLPDYAGHSAIKARK